MTTKQKTDERAKQPEGSTVRELMDERDEYKSGAKNACIGLSVAVAEIATLTARIEALHLMQELGEDLAWRSYLGIQVLQTVLKKSKLEAGADVSAKLLTDIAAQYPHFPAKSALRPMPDHRALENKP